MPGLLRAPAVGRPRRPRDPGGGARGAVRPASSPGRTTAEWDDALAAAGVPAAPVRERDDLFDDEQAWAEGLLERVEDDEVGDMVMTAPVVRLSDSPGAIRFAGRHLGADTREVLRELGLADGDIDALVADGAAVLRPVSTIRRRVVVHGQVQGVFFRDSTRRARGGPRRGRLGA